MGCIVRGKHISDRKEGVLNHVGFLLSSHLPSLLVGRESSKAPPLPRQ